MRRHIPLCLLLSAACLSLVGCKQNEKDDGIETGKSALTPGEVKTRIVKGQTSQAQVHDAFGSPDQILRENSRDIWVYDKTNFEYDKRSDYFTVLFAGNGGDKVRTSSRSVMLKIYFDEHDVVSDYKLSATRF